MDILRRKILHPSADRETPAIASSRPVNTEEREVSTSPFNSSAKSLSLRSKSPLQFKLKKQVRRLTVDQTIEEFYKDRKHIDIE